MKTIYLCGGMEKADDLGADWRKEVTPKLEAKGYKVLDPVILEGEKSKKLIGEFKPRSFRYWKTGELMLAMHWHQLKNAAMDTKEFKLFCDIMSDIREYDYTLVAKSDVILVLWNESAGMGAGSHGEIEFASRLFMKKIIVVEESPLPAWLVPLINARYATIDEALGVL